MSKAQTDIRATSYNAATANPRGYIGTLDDALAQVRAEPDEVRTYWPFNVSRERHELLGFLGVGRSKLDMSGAQQRVRSSDITRYELGLMAAIPEDDSVEYGAPVAPSEPPFYSLAYAQKHFPETFKQ